MDAAKPLCKIIHSLNHLRSQARKALKLVHLWNFHAGLATFGIMLPRFDIRFKNLMKVEHQILEDICPFWLN